MDLSTQLLVHAVLSSSWFLLKSEYKKARADLKKKSLDTIKLQKKVKKGENLCLSFFMFVGNYKLIRWAIWLCHKVQYILVGEKKLNWPCALIFLKLFSVIPTPININPLVFTVFGVVISSERYPRWRYNIKVVDNLEMMWCPLCTYIYFSNLVHPCLWWPFYLIRGSWGLKERTEGRILGEFVLHFSPFLF